MRAIAYSEIERMVATGMGWDATNLSGEERDSIRQALNESLKWTWEWDWWPDVMECRNLALRDDWSLQNIAIYGPYTVGDQVYFADSGRYYMAINDVQGEPPASWNATTEAWDETPTRWKELATSYEATPWVPEESYPETEYTTNSVFSYDGRYWLPTLELLEAGIGSYSPGRYPQSWLELPTLDNVLPTVGRNRPMIGEMRGVTELDPRTTQAPLPYQWDQTTDGVLVYDFKGPRLWAEYRRACPNFLGSLWSASEAYSAAPEYENLYGETEEPETEPAGVVVAPVVLPGSGTFTGSQVVTMTCATAGAAIRYTTDGSTPTDSTGTLYTAQFTVTASMTIKAVAFKSGMSDSAVTTVSLTRTYAIYSGASVEALLDAAGIMAMGGRYADDPAGAYAFTLVTPPDQYLYLAWPDALADQPVAATGFSVDGLAMTGDLADAAEGYSSTENGWPFRSLTVDGAAYRVYRTRYLQGSLAGTITITITT